MLLGLGTSVMRAQFPQTGTDHNVERWQRTESGTDRPTPFKCDECKVNDACYNVAGSMLCSRCRQAQWQPAPRGALPESE